METVAVLLFTATFAVLVGYAARRRWSAGRSRELENADRTDSMELTVQANRLEVFGGSREDQDRILEEWLDRQAGKSRPREYRYETGEPLDPDEVEEFRAKESTEEETATQPETIVVHASEADAPPPPAPRAAGLLSSIRMIHVVTLLFLLASFWIILSNKCDDDVQKWAFGAMGSVLGFWLGPGRD